MTEPLKPRIDFDGPLEVDQNPKFRAQQTFDENQAQNFAPATGRIAARAHLPYLPARQSAQAE